LPPGPVGLPPGPGRFAAGARPVWLRGPARDIGRGPVARVAVGLAAGLPGPARGLGRNLPAASARVSWRFGPGLARRASSGSGRPPRPVAASGSGRPPRPVAASGSGRPPRPVAASGSGSPSLVRIWLAALSGLLPAGSPTSCPPPRLGLPRPGLARRLVRVLRAASARACSQPRPNLAYDLVCGVACGLARGPARTLARPVMRASSPSCDARQE